MSTFLKRIVNAIEPPKFDPRKYGRKHTPDVLALQQFKRHLVFLPCNLQQGKAYHSLLTDSPEYQGVAYTRGKYMMYVKQLGNESFPIPLPGVAERKVIRTRLNDHFDPPSARIRGELYWVSPDCLMENLDNHKLNGVEFARKRIEVVLPYKDPITQVNRDTGQLEANFSGEKTWIYSAWFYEGVEDYWDKQIDAGYLFKPGTLYQSRKKWMDKFYEFR